MDLLNNNMSCPARAPLNPDTTNNNVYNTHTATEEITEIILLGKLRSREEILHNILLVLGILFSIMSVVDFFFAAIYKILSKRYYSVAQRCICKDMDKQPCKEMDTERKPSDNQEGDDVKKPPTNK